MRFVLIVKNILEVAITGSKGYYSFRRRGSDAAGFYRPFQGCIFLVNFTVSKKKNSS